MKPKLPMPKLPILTLLLGLCCALRPADAQVYASPPPPTLDKAAFEDSLVGALDGNVMGYQFVLIKDGRIASERAGGNARNAADGLLPMTTHTPLNVGSLMKFVTGTAMLHLMEHPQRLGFRRNPTLAQRLDEPMSGPFPQLWRDAMMPGVEAITYRQLLQHRSGFDTDFAGPRTVLGYLAGGFVPGQFGVREYANINFVLAGYSLPLVDDPQFGTNLEAAAPGFGVPPAALDGWLRDWLGNRMDGLLHERLWDRMTPPLQPSCDAANVFAATAARGYRSRTDPSPGVISSSIDKNGHCKGEGGYYFSSRDFAEYVAYVGSTELVVSKAARDLMYRDDMPNANDRLVWSSATGGGSNEAWFADKFGVPRIAWSNGVTDGAKAVLLRLPLDHYLVVFTNSNELSSGQLYAAGVAAFRAGMEHNFP